MSITTLPCPLAPIRTTSVIAPPASGESRHVRMAGLRQPLGGDDLLHRLPEDPQVEPDGAVIDIPDVEAQALFPGLRVAAVDLRPAGDAGPHFVPARLLGRIEREIFRQERPRADEAHVAAQHIPELRQLVKAVAAQRAAERREAL